MQITQQEQVIAQARSQQIGDLLQRSAARAPQKTALVFRDHRDSFAELNDIVNRTANAFAARGVAKGDRVALLSHNNRAFVIIRFALARIGAIMTPINFMLNAGDVAYVLNHSGATTLIAEDALVSVAHEALGSVTHPVANRIYIPGNGIEVSDDWSDVNSLFSFADNTMPYVEMSPEEPIQMMYTSGTESRPKGALLSTSALYAQYVSCIVDGDMSEDDIELHCMPLFHCAQLDCFLTPDLYLGATSVLLPGADPTEILAKIAEEKITKLFCPPTVWIALLRHPNFDNTDLSSLTKGYYGASIMPTAIIEELASRVPQMALCNFYGQTEMAPLATVLKPADQLRKIGSAGRPGLNVETRLVDDDGRDVPIGEVGEIVHRSPHLTLGYYNDPEKSAEAFAHGWFHSGDLGRFDEEGYLYVVDRKKDMIKSGGENVASREVEEAIFRHPSVAEVAVFGLPHETWIEAVTAIVVPKTGMTLTVEELQDFCQDTLSTFKRPKNISIIDKLPKNASGKILKRELRETFSSKF